LALCAAVLLGFSWPWFKLQYMSNTERFRPHDGWLLLFTLLLVSAGVTLILLNSSYVRRSTGRADAAMRSLADQMKANFELEISRALCQLVEIQGTEEFKTVLKGEGGFRSLASYPIENDAGRSYPYFEMAFWADDQGNQLAKLDVRKVATPAAPLNGIPFYKAVKSGAAWTVPAHAAKTQPCASVSNDQDLWSSSFFQPILSPNTNEFAPVLAAPFHLKPQTVPPISAVDANRVAVQVLVFRPMSVIDPVLPPGYAFAVIDSKCTVLFHSDSFRDMRENFCQESKDSSELNAWLFSGVNTPIDITYGGKARRAYLTNFPLPGLSAEHTDYLVIFQDGDQQLTLDLAANLVTAILLGIYFSVLILGAAGYLILRGPFRWEYAPRIVWPCRELAVQYLQVFILSALLCALYRSFYHTLHEAPLVGLTLGVALLSVLFAVLRLMAAPNVLFGFGMAVGSAALLGWVAILLVYLKLRPTISSSALESLKEWSTLLYLPLTFGVFAIIASGQLKSLANKLNQNPTFLNKFRELVTSHSNLLYSLAAVSLIACGSVIPSIGAFKYAYDAVSEIALKHDESVLADRLVTRKNRIETSYTALNAPQIGEARLLESLDRYDKSGRNESTTNAEAFFHTCHEPAFRGHPDSRSCPEDTKKDKVDFGLNDWIEKQIAAATLTFPSNELGSEIKRLGVAETKASDSWEHFWLEPSATTFTLRWKENSRAPFFTVWADYPEWQGFGDWERACLPVLLAILVLWLMSLAKKIFLTNVDGAPFIEIAKWRQVSDIKGDSLVIGLPRSGKSTQLKKLEGLDPRDFRDLRDFQSDRSGVSKLCELESTDGHSGVIVIDQFDFNMRDPAWNQKRLDLISKLLNESDQKLVLVSTVDPLYFLIEERCDVLASERDSKVTDLLLERWARALDRFSRVKLSGTVGDEFAEKADKFFEQGGQFAQFAKWICNECSYTPMLQKIGVELLDRFQKLPLPTRQQLVRMVADRAGAYYRMLWAGLTSSERLVLYQLALDGWANPKNAPAIQQLEQKQLVYRQPMYRIMNDSFRSFIRCSEHEKEIAVWQKQEQQSTWPILRFAMIAAIVGVGAWLLYAQGQLFQIGTGYITAMATLLTAIASFAARAKRVSSAPPTNSATES
jgi:hypothetical protein